MKNLPNRITVSRIVMIFIFLILSTVTEKPGSSVFTKTLEYNCHVIAYIVAIIAGLTDFFDGYLARKYNWVSNFGALMDPLADKIFVTTTFIVLADYQYISAWVPVVIISREFLVTGLRLLATQQGEVISADKWGKLKTFLQMMLLFVGGAAWINIFDLKSIGIIWDIAVWAIVVITIFSGVGYFVKHRNLYADNT